MLVVRGNRKQNQHVEDKLEDIKKRRRKSNNREIGQRLKQKTDEQHRVEYRDEEKNAQELHICKNRR